MSEQGSEGWFLERAGCATASRFADIISVSKRDGSPLKARTDYVWTLATERIYAEPTEAISARSLEWGKALEPFAANAYEVITGEILIPTGFVLHPSIAYCGGSPDGLIGRNGGIEIKCPKDKRVHMQTWCNGMSPDHLPQVQGNIWVNEREWFDFISYDPRAPEHLRTYVQRVYRNEMYIKALESHVVEFLEEVDKLVGAINGKEDGNLRGACAADD
ncbi:MAG: lambda exonuclease family protein [Pseudomonadota bacterium]